ncbi:immunoglobulin superfamily member 5 isoform X4 [Oncorhynchus nerka]|uniref:immunoglobulin superfamily member 5 isoform X4 n=1 Tax=Oncorhynchus nerka TaxID=8023 RepID=UPI001131E927|nr:immunoglobulin superfamily member 5 isoform X4 [Oncorhynchus nerka]
MASVFFTLLLLYATGVSGVPQLEPLNVTVLRGSEARFNISLSEAWYSMSWMLKSVLVLTINSGTGESEHNRRFSVKNYSSADIYCWEFIIRDVWRNDSGTVSCGVQEKPTQTAQLFVQESGTVRIVGGNITVAQGHQAIVQCEASGWFPKPTVSWVVDGVMVDQNSYNSSSEALDSLYNSISFLTVRGVNSVQVKCLASVSALTTPLSSSIYLVVDHCFTRAPRLDCAHRCRLFHRWLRSAGAAHPWNRLLLQTQKRSKIQLPEGNGENEVPDRDEWWCSGTETGQGKPCIRDRRPNNRCHPQ